MTCAAARVQECGRGADSDGFDLIGPLREEDRSSDGCEPSKAPHGKHAIIIERWDPIRFCRFLLRNTDNMMD